MPSVADEQMLSNFIIWLTSPQERRFITMILHLSICLSIRMLSILLATLKLYFSWKTKTSKITSGLPRSQSYLQKNCFIQKLTFPLCRACVQEEMEKPMLQRSRVCSHSDSERQITGTWCTPELNKAIEKGYKITYIHEVWHFSETRKGLFKDYVNTWLKIKE